MTTAEDTQQAQLIALPELPEVNPTGPALLGNTKLLDSVKVALSVTVGQAETTLGELMSLKEASILKLDRPVDCPVDLLVNGNVVARGQLVVVDEHFGVRITEIAASQNG